MSAENRAFYRGYCQVLRAPPICFGSIDLSPPAAKQEIINAAAKNIYAKGSYG